MVTWGTNSQVKVASVPGYLRVVCGWFRDVRVGRSRLTSAAALTPVEYLELSPAATWRLEAVDALTGQPLNGGPPE